MQRMTAAHRIQVLSKPIDRTLLAQMLGDPFPDMIKFVVDLDRNKVALGGELHADAEALLLEQGAVQEALWGGNYFPGLGEDDCIEFTSMINVRPSAGNRSMLVQSKELQTRIRGLIFAFVGRGEPLP
jgi:hypothetical protein